MSSNSTAWKTIIDAANHTDLEAIKDFVNAHKPDLTTTNAAGQTAAHIAAKNGNLNLVKYLLDVEPSLIHVKDTWEQSIFHVAVQNGALDCVKYLVTHHNASLFESNLLFPGSAAIHIAAALGKLDIVQYLTRERCVDANLRNGAGQPAAFSAAAFNHLSVIKYLVEETDTNITTTDDSGDNILHVCARKGNLTVPKYLLDEKKIVFDFDYRNRMGETVVNRAAVFNNFKFIEYFVEEKNARVDIPDNKGSTPLHEAASVSGVKLVKYLVAKGARMNATDNQGHTPKDLASDPKILEFFHRRMTATKRRRRRRRQTQESNSTKWRDIFDAAEHGDLPAVKYYIEEGGTILQDANPKGETVVHIAARNDNIEIMEYMLDKAPLLVRVKDMETNSPLHLATKYGHLDVVKYLLDKRKADLLEKNYIELGNTVVHMAAGTGNMMMLKFFIEERRIDVDIRNDLQWTPIFLAATNNHMGVVKYLFEERKANVTVTDANDDNILYVTAKTGNLDLPRYLLDEKKVYFDVNWQDKFGETVVKRAARWGQLEFIKYLVDEKHADINLRDKNLRTPLHEAACIGYKDVVQFFIERGADPEARDQWGRNHTHDDTYREVLDELQKMNITGVGRKRRNVFSATPIPYRERHLIDSENNHTNHVTLPILDSFLILAQICIRYFCGCERRATLSPPEIIHQRIDPVVFGAFDSDFDRWYTF